MYKESRISVFSHSIFSASSSSTTDSSTERRYSEDEDEDESESDEEDSFDLESVFRNEKRNPVKKVVTHEAYCFDVKKFSEKLVEATFIEANKQLTHKEKQVTVFDIIVPIINYLIKLVLPSESEINLCPVTPGFFYKEPSEFSYDISLDTSMDWPKISEFNIKLGLEKLEDYVSSWQGLGDWLFCVEFLGFESEDCSNIFVYEVEWSKPTYAYPIPQATASVYFALEVFKMVPYTYDRNIEVSYIFESSSVIHLPGRIDFQEKWLQDILDAKIAFFKTVTFGDGNSANSSNASSKFITSTVISPNLANDESHSPISSIGFQK